jgi:polyphenol oxidase
MAVDVLTCPTFGATPHGFFGRTGGVSNAMYQSLNVGLGSNDNAEHVRENRRRAVAAVAPNATLVTVHQIHSATAVMVEAAWPDDARPSADALVTNRLGLALGVLTADCAPILLVDPDKQIIGAAHAGWKGALHGIVESVVRMMTKLGAQPDSIRAVVGPTIALKSYEVDDAFRLRFEMHDDQSEQFFASGQRALRHQFDLEGYVGLQLARAGIRHASLMGEDTYSQTEKYFSYRRATHAGEADYGRQLSLISLVGT